MTKIADSIERVLKLICEVFMWANFVLIFVIVFQVIARYAFNWTSTSVEELQWHLYSIAMLTGIAYGITSDSHVRADILFSKFSDKWKNIVEILVIVLFILPFFTFIFYHSISFVERSYAVSEASSSPGGLPFRWLIKGVIPLACCLINLAALAKLLRTIGKMRSKDVS